MLPYAPLLREFTTGCRAILGGELVGIYLHGSAAMGCFRAAVSDLDLLVVVEAPLSRRTKTALLALAAAVDRAGPPKGLEFSVVREAVCRPFRYPTPFELHFSMAYRAAYRAGPDAFLDAMPETDRDLAAHFMMTLHRGRRLWGKEIAAVFSDVSPAAFWDSLRNDLSDCETAILTQPVYVILNLCRALAYREAGLFLSKEEGGAWALAHLSAPDAKALVAQALASYAGEGSMAPEEQSAAAFARTMLRRLDSH